MGDQRKKQKKKPKRKKEEGEEKEKEKKSFKLKAPKVPAFLRSKSKEREKNKDKTGEEKAEEKPKEAEKEAADETTEEKPPGKDAKTKVKEAFNNIHMPKMPKLHKPAFLKKKKTDGEAAPDAEGDAPAEAKEC